MPKLEQQLDVPSLHHPPLPTPHVLPQMIHQICKKTVSLSEVVVIQLNCALILPKKEGVFLFCAQPRTDTLSLRNGVNSFVTMQTHPHLWTEEASHDKMLSPC